MNDLTKVDAYWMQKYVDLKERDLALLNEHELVIQQQSWIIKYLHNQLDECKKCLRNS